MDFLDTIERKTGRSLCRLGLSASYRPGKDAIRQAIDRGVNVFFCFGIDTQMTSVLAEVLPRERERFFVVTGAYNYYWGRQNFARTLEKRLRQLKTDYVDAFLYLGVTKPEHFPEDARDELARLREDKRVGGVGLSCHHRPLAGELAARGDVDLLMIRYNAAHRGAETDIFPHLTAHRPIVLNYTATRWTALLRRPRGWPKPGRLPTAGECYRFALSSPHVDLCLQAPRNARELCENLDACRQGPLAGEDHRFLCEFGDAVHARHRWFM